MSIAIFQLYLKSIVQQKLKGLFESSKLSCTITLIFLSYPFCSFLATFWPHLYIVFLLNQRSTASASSQDFAVIWLLLTGNYSTSDK